MRNTQQGFEIHSAMGQRLAGRWMLGVGALCAVGATIPLFYEPQAWPLWIVPGVLLPIGLIFSQLGFTTTVSTASSRVQLRDGSRPFDAFVAVLVSSGIRTVASEHGNSQVREWTVGLVSAEIDDDATQQLEAIREAIDGTEELADEARAKMLEELARWQSTLERTEVRVTATSDEHDAWRIGERLAKAMELPMVDFSGAEPIERTPQQLDLSLAERLRGADAVPEPVGPAPLGMTVDSATSRLVLRWTFSWDGALVFVFVVLAAAIGAGLWLGVTMSWIAGGPMIAMFSLFGVLMVLLGRGRGRNELEISDGVLHHITHFPWTKRVSMPLAKLEHIRQQTEPQAFVSLVSDARLVRLLVDAERGRWLVHKLEHWLVTEGP